jgi:copper chaperone CopZ
MKIDVLYFDECPNHGPTVERAREALHQEDLAANVVEVNIPDDATARSLGFLGSPTVRIDGIDIEPSARLSKEFGLMCRTYSDRGKQVGVPPLDLIRTALRQAVNRQSAAHDCCQKPTGEVVSPESSSPKGRRFLFGASVAAGVAFEKWRPYLLGLTGLLLAGSVLFAWHDHKRACTPGGFCATKPMSRWNYVALAILAAGVIALAAFPYYSGAVAQIVVRQPSPTHAASSVALSTVTFRVPDMDCPACAVALSAALDKLPGVAHAKLDVSSRQAVVTYDPATQDAAALEKVISDAGFHIAPGPGSS